MDDGIGKSIYVVIASERPVYHARTLFIRAVMCNLSCLEQQTTYGTQASGVVDVSNICVPPVLGACIACTQDSGNMIPASA